MAKIDNYFNIRPNGIAQRNISIKQDLLQNCADALEYLLVNVYGPQTSISEVWCRAVIDLAKIEKESASPDAAL